MRAAERRLYGAMRRVDYDELDALISDDATYVHSNGVEETKAQYLEALHEGLYEYGPIRTKGVVIHCWGDSAVARAHVRMSVSRRGERKSVVALLSTLIWVREGRDWRLLRRHATRLAEYE